MRRKTVRQKPDKVETEETPIPRYFYGLHKFVPLTTDVIFVNGVPFLVTLSRNIRLFTVELVKMTDYLVKVSKLYARGGFTVRTILMDQEFDKVKDKMPSLEDNTTAAREHVGEIKRSTKLVKERCWGTRAIMPFQQILLEL